MGTTNILGVLQALALLGAAWFAWRTYTANRTEQARAPRRRLLEDAIFELKALAATVETNDVGATAGERAIRAAQKRLSLALASTTWISMLNASEASYLEPAELDWHKMQDAMADLGFALRWLELDKSGLGEYTDDGNDRPPLPSPPKTVRERWRRSRLRWRFRRFVGWLTARLRRHGR